jgi:zinc protease
MRGVFASNRSARPGLRSSTFVAACAVALTLAPGSLASAAAVAKPAAAGAAASGAKPPVVRLDFEKYTLSNGLEVILRRDARVPIAAVNLWYHVGPANETAGRTGFAHLFEHMMFQGSGHVADEAHFRLLEGAGSSFVNASTDFDRTNYMEEVPSNQLELALWLESDRMGFLLDRLDQTVLSNQQDVVRNERREAVENTPYGVADEKVFHMLFPAGHPYQAYVIGSHTDIQAAKLDDVRSFFRQYYVPNNASLAIVGDIDLANTRALVAKYFGSIPRGRPVAPVLATTPRITQERRAVVADKVELPKVYLAWHTAPIFKPGDAEAVLAAEILAGGKGSRLYSSLVYERKIAQEVTASQQSLTLGSVFQITATAKPGHTAEELEHVIEMEIEKLGASGPTQAELIAAQNGTYSSIVTSLENLLGSDDGDGVADRLNLYNHHQGDPGYLARDLARYGAVMREGVRRFARSLTRNSRVVIHAVPGEPVVDAGPPTPPAPGKSAARVQSNEPWRSEPPSPGPLSTAPLPSARSFKLDNGLRVYLVEAHTLPIVTVQLTVRSGSGADPADAPGLAGFTTSMLDEGTSKHDALALARELEAVGATLGTGSNADGSFVFTRTLKSTADKVMELMSEVTLEPAFPANEVERVRNDRLTAVLQEKDSPVQLALRVLYPSLFGAHHPYGHTPLGSEDALKRATRDELVRFYGDHFRPDNAALVLAGDLTEPEARALATRTFGGWSGTAKRADAKQAGGPVPERVILVDKPGATQTLLLVAQRGVRRSDPDFERLNLMNTVLGSAFSSRLNLNLREKNGYTYGAFSALTERRDTGILLAGASVRADVTGASIQETMRELNGMREHPITAEETAFAREAVSRALPSQFMTTQSTAGTIGSLYLWDLPADYYQGLPARLAALTAADVQAATMKLLAPDRMVIVAVGDRAKIEPQITPLSLGAIRNQRADGAASSAAP